MQAQIYKCHRQLIIITGLVSIPQSLIIHQWILKSRGTPIQEKPLSPAIVSNWSQCSHSIPKRAMTLPIWPKLFTMGSSNLRQPPIFISRPVKCLDMRWPQLQIHWLKAICSTMDQTWVSIIRVFRIHIMYRMNWTEDNRYWKWVTFTVFDYMENF